MSRSGAAREIAKENETLLAEKAVLGAMLLNPDAIDPVVDILGRGPKVFLSEPNQHIYQAILSVMRKKKRCDSALLLDELSAIKKIDAAGGVAYISEVTGSVPTSANAEYYAGVVYTQAARRALLIRTRNYFQRLQKGGGDLNELLADADSLSRGIADPDSNFDVMALAEFIDDSCEDMMRASEHDGVSGLATGFYGLDQLTGGLAPSDMIVVAARTSEGKTAFALNMALNMAVLGTPVLFFSMEMSRKQLGRRFLHRRANITLEDLRRMSPDMRRRLHTETENLKQLPLYVDDTPAIKPSLAKARTRRAMSKFGVRAVFIDYLQLMKPSDKTESKRTAIDAISKEIKQMAKDLDVPVVALAQLTREADDKPPRLVHLKESGAIEEDADVVILLSRDPESVWSIIVDVAKQRNRPVAKHKMEFFKHMQRFDDVPAPPPRQSELEYEDGDDPRTLIS